MIPALRSRVPLLGVLVALAFAGPATAQVPEREAAVEALEQVEAIAQGEGVRTGRELSPALAALAARRSDLSSSQRREANGLLARPTDAGDIGPGALRSYTVPSTSSCSTNFCVHWVESTSDAPPGADGNPATIPAYVDTMKAAFEQSFTVENTQLGWRTAVPDAGRGGNNLTDVYIQNIGSEGIFGYASTDPQPASRSQYAYLVMDNDYSFAEFEYIDPQDPLEVTAAHEYNHVLQYAYDTLQDTWMFESTATWAEEKVFDAVNDYRSYLRPWADLPSQPLTYAGDNALPFDDDLKMYGSAIWNHWLDSRYGAQVVRQAWAISQANSVAGGGFAPGAYDRAIRDAGGPGFAAEFVDFTASTAEWDAFNSGVREGPTFPKEVMRNGSLSLNGPPSIGALNHTGFALFRVPRTIAANLRLTGGLPAGTTGSIALVGFAGSALTKVVGVLDADGQVTVTLPDPGRFDRVTAVVTNADTSHRGFGGNDWLWAKDAQPVSLTATDAEPPTVTPTPTPTATATPTPPPPPPPPPATSVRLTRSSTLLKTVARKGLLSFFATVNKPGALSATATVDAATAKRLKIGRRSVRIGTGKRTASRAQKLKVNLRLSRKVRAALKRQTRSLKVKVRTRFVPAGGGAAVVRSISLRLKP